MRLLTVLTLFFCAMTMKAAFADEEAQNLCIQDRMAKCQSKCEAAGGSGCDALCEDNVRNECLYAGE